MKQIYRVEVQANEDFGECGVLDFMSVKLPNEAKSDKLAEMRSLPDAR